MNKRELLEQIEVRSYIEDPCLYNIVTKSVIKKPFTDFNNMLEIQARTMYLAILHDSVEWMYYCRVNLTMVKLKHMEESDSVPFVEIDEIRTKHIFLNSIMILESDNPEITITERRKFNKPVAEKIIREAIKYVKELRTSNI